MHLHLGLATALLALAGAAAAQTTRTVPPYFANVEGNSRHTYPFGRDEAKLQVLIDAPWVTTGSGAVVSIAMRAEGFPANAYAAYTKPYAITAWTTPVKAAAMTIDPIANAGNATPTVVFRGPVNVPASAPTPTTPRPFALRIVFNTPYLYNGANGSLLLQIDTADKVAPPGAWTLDAAFLRTTAAEAAATQVAERCQNASGQRLTLTPSRTFATVGGSLDFSVASSAQGAFPQVVAFLGGTNKAPGLPFDLGAVGMPGCLLAVDPVLTQVRQETASGYQNLNWPIPNNPAFTYAPIYVQALGWASPTSTFAGSVTSRAHLLLIGPSRAPLSMAKSIFWLASRNQWFISPTGDYLPVLQLTGVLP